MAKRKTPPTRIEIEGAATQEEVHEEAAESVSKVDAAPQEPKKSGTVEVATEPSPSSEPKASPQTTVSAKKGRQVKIEVDSKSEKADPSAGRSAGSASSRSSVAMNAQEGAKGDKPASQVAIEWASEHMHAVIGGIFGLVAALCIFCIGFWKTLFVSLLVCAGIALGQYLDGDPKIINFLRRLLLGGSGDE